MLWSSVCGWCETSFLKYLFSAKNLFSWGAQDREELFQTWMNRMFCSSWPLTSGIQHNRPADCLQTSAFQWIFPLGRHNAADGFFVFHSMVLFFSLSAGPKRVSHYFKLSDSFFLNYAIKLLQLSAKKLWNKNNLVVLHTTFKRQFAAISLPYFAPLPRKSFYCSWQWHIKLEDLLRSEWKWRGKQGRAAIASKQK